MADVGRTGLQRAWLDLEWRFGECEAVLGLHGVPVERCGSRPWDEAREERAHLARRRPEHRRDVAKMRRIDASLAKLDLAIRQVLEAACTPLQLPWRDDLHGVQLREAFKREGTHLSTLAVVLGGGEVREAWGERFMSSAEVWLIPSKHDLLRFLEGEAHHGVSRNKKGKLTNRSANSALLRRLHQAAEARIREAVRAYAVADKEMSQLRRKALELMEDGHASW